MNVTCPAGTFSGSSVNGVHEFKGIRYATSERFCPPTPYDYPEGIHEMLEDAPYAIQHEAQLETHLTGMDYMNYPQEENCQYLSITAPDHDPQHGKLPVMVWVHGGSYRNGGCDAACYNRRYLALEGDVIVVGINFRIGLLGFLRNHDGNLSNNGLLDIIEALKWIKRNIESFGGDSDNITLFGHSSGADAVRSVILSEGTERLYSKAIIQSDPIGAMNADRDDMSRKMLEEAMQMPADADVETIRGVQLSLRDHVTEESLAKHLIFGPHYGLYPLPKKEDFNDHLREMAKDHPLMIGTTTREVSSYIYPNKTLTFLDKFPLTGWYIEKRIIATTEEVFGEPSREFAEQYAEAGGETFHYTYRWHEHQKPIGASHGSELTLLFSADYLPDDADLLKGTNKQEIHDTGKNLRKIWTTFARTGNPQSKGIDNVIDIRQM